MKIYEMVSLKTNKSNKVVKVFELQTEIRNLQKRVKPPYKDWGGEEYAWGMREGYERVLVMLEEKVSK